MYDLTNLVPEPVLRIPDVILLNLRLVVRPDLLNAQDLCFEEIHRLSVQLMPL